MKTQKFNLEIGGKNLQVEFSNLAEQANGSCLVKYGDTTILGTSVMGQEREGIDFFPLTVEYEEKYYAAGKIKGPRYIKRESRPSDEAICNGRLIDRAIRPRFSKDIKREVQVITTVLSWDAENDPDTAALIAASLALLVSDIPWQGPVAAARVGRVEGNFVLNPTYQEREKSDMDIVFAAVVEGGRLLINMIEGGFDEVQEQDIEDALSFAKNPLQEIVAFQEEISKKIGKEKIEVSSSEKDLELEKEIKEHLGKNLQDAIFEKDKVKRIQSLSALQEELSDFIGAKYQDQKKVKYAQNFFEEQVNGIIHENIIKYEKRPDGRKLDELREIYAQVGILPRTHGSGLFFRGQTKALSILTLGTPDDRQLLEGMEVFGQKRFMHHYNFPPYSTGETKPLRGPGRREIGHGMLAEKALLPLIPGFEEFPYTIRIVSEMLSSNGSTSMASVCSSSLALMDAGVKIKRPAAGIAIGLMQSPGGEEYKVLTDIQGPEDHHGDMDFKVAGTREGITALQLDVKIAGIAEEIVKEALSRAKKARHEILDAIEKVLPEPRKELSVFAPRILTIQINPDKIREVVGPGGKVINQIIEQTGATIDIQQSGKVFVASEKLEAAEKAVEWIKNIIREVEVGEIFKGRVNRILTFGAFVEILPGQDGMIHISKLSQRRVDKVEDVVKIGDLVEVKVISIDERGRIDLALIHNSGQEK